MGKSFVRDYTVRFGEIDHAEIFIQPAGVIWVYAYEMQHCTAVDIEPASGKRKVGSVAIDHAEYVDIKFSGSVQFCGADRAVIQRA